MRYVTEIMIKMPSLNEYVRQCRGNRYGASKMVRDLEDAIAYFVKDMPMFKRPVLIRFKWIEKNRRRDLDNVCFAKKFILDALVKAGKLTDDSQRYVKGFEDSFELGDETKVIIDIEEIAND